MNSKDRLLSAPSDDEEEVHERKGYVPHRIRESDTKNSPRLGRKELVEMLEHLDSESDEEPKGDAEAAEVGEVVEDENKSSIFVNVEKVPQEVWEGKEGEFLRKRCSNMSSVLGNSLVGVEFFTNASHMAYGAGEVMTGVNITLKPDTNAWKMQMFAQPFYQRFSVFDLGKIDKDVLDTLTPQVLKDIVDPPKARGSGIIGVGGDNEHEKVNLYEMYNSRVDGEESSWSCSLGDCSAYAMIARENEAYKLVLCGGHVSVNYGFWNYVQAENVTFSSFFKGNHVGFFSDMKRLQMINHAKICARVKHFINEGEIYGEKNSNFVTDDDPEYAFFFNVPYLNDHRNVTLPQGLVNLASDVDFNSNRSYTSVYMLETPQRMVKIRVPERLANHMNFFPMTTGHREYSGEALGKDSRKNLAVTGISQITNIAQMYYTPYDNDLQILMSNLYGRYGAAAIYDRVYLDAICTVWAELDVRSIGYDTLLRYTSDMGKDEHVSLRENSDWVTTIRNTWPTVQKYLVGGGKPLQLSQVMKPHKESEYFNTIQLGPMRTAHAMKQKEKVTGPIFVFGSERFY